MRRNAQQLLGVVKAKFSSASYSTKNKSTECNDLDSSGDILLCKYQQADLCTDPHDKVQKLIQVGSLI